MKAKTLSVLAGVSAPLILGGAASAGFVGVKTVLKAPNPYASCSAALPALTTNSTSACIEP